MNGNCPACGMKCGDTCYRPVKLDVEAMRIKQEQAAARQDGYNAGYQAGIEEGKRIGMKRAAEVSVITADSAVTWGDYRCDCAEAIEKEIGE